MTAPLNEQENSLFKKDLLRYLWSACGEKSVLGKKVFI